MIENRYHGERMTTERSIGPTTAATASAPHSNFSFVFTVHSSWSNGQARAASMRFSRSRERREAGGLVRSVPAFSGPLKPDREECGPRRKPGSAGLDQHIKQRTEATQCVGVQPPTYSSVVVASVVEPEHHGPAIDELPADDLLIE